MPQRSGVVEGLPLKQVGVDSWEVDAVIGPEADRFDVELGW